MRGTLLVIGLTLSIAACGGGTLNSSDITTASTGKAAAADPAYRILSKEELAKTLLSLRDVPPGYSQDPPADEGAGKTFCDYPPPFKEKIGVRQDFTKGGGLSAELLSVGLRQYADADQAKASFEALANALASCPSETFGGTKATYAPMSAPKVGDGSIGVKITADSTDVLQFFAVAGPVLVNTGGGGLLNANADEVMSLLKAQVTKYEASAAA